MYTLLQGIIKSIRSWIFCCVFVHSSNTHAARCCCCYCCCCESTATKDRPRQHGHICKMLCVSEYAMLSRTTKRAPPVVEKSNHRICGNIPSGVLYINMAMLTCPPAARACVNLLAFCSRITLWSASTSQLFVIKGCGYGIELGAPANHLLFVALART